MRLKHVLLLLVATASSLLLSACDNPLQKPALAGLQVITNNVPASIYLDDRYIDKAPLVDRNLPPGEYKLQIRPDDQNLSSYDTVVNLRPAVITVVTWKPADSPETSGGVIYEMEKLPTKDATEVVVSSVPESAIVTFGDSNQQLAPITVNDLPPGEHEYQISLPSYESQQNTINVVPGYRMIITVKLAKQAVAERNSNSPTSLETNSQATVAGVMVGESINNQPSATQSPTPQPSTIAPTLAPTATPIPSATLKPTSTPAPTPTPRPNVTILSTGYKVDNQEVLRVRSEPSSTSAELGLAPVGTKYPYLGEKNLDWLKIQYQGKAGWVKEQFVNLEK